MYIKEIIVVEGRDDVTAVKRAVDAEMITTHGFGITEKTFRRIADAQKRCGVIIFTDPDTAGERIRKRIEERVPGCKHAFLPKNEATAKDGDIGIENAKPADIRAALSKVRVKVDKSSDIFEKQDLVMCDLVGQPDATRRRDRLGKILGIGYGNAKQFLKRLNHYGVTRDEFAAALEQLDKEDRACN